jgi:hypothetical protein
MTSYEEVLELVENVPRAASAEVRDIHWLTGAQVLGVARDPQGQIEIFLQGKQLVADSRIVGDALEFRSWHRKDAADLEANRLVFPALGHFDQVSGFICTELLRQQADTQLVKSFKTVEPLIELSIERIRMADEVKIGLAGELLLLDALCRRADDEQVRLVVDSWDGWQRSARDFTWKNTGVEVKTTLRNSSSHLVEGIHQVEIDDGEGGSTEDHLYLVSVGLQRTEDGGNSFTIPQLVGRILDRMASAGCGGGHGKLLFRIAEYGPGEGYDHATMATEPSFNTSYLTTFIRAYDMSDDGVRVLRRDDIASHEHVDIDSVKFRVLLPAAVGPNNPVVGANQVADLILQRLI